MKWALLAVATLALFLVFSAVQRGETRSPPANVPLRPDAAGRSAPRERRHAVEAARSDAGAPPATGTVAAKPLPPVDPGHPRRFLRKWTAEEITKRFADVVPRPGQERFRDEMLHGAAWTQLSEIVEEDFDRATDAFTDFAIANWERRGSVVDADARRRLHDLDRAYWRLIADLQRRKVTISRRLTARDYRDDSEKKALEIQESDLDQVTMDLHRELIREEGDVFEPRPR